MSRQRTRHVKMAPPTTSDRIATSFARRQGGTMSEYEAPEIQEVGSVRDMTLGQFFQDGQDFFSTIPVIGFIFGS
jgi:hypothetical protein